LEFPNGSSSLKGSDYFAIRGKIVSTKLSPFLSTVKKWVIFLKIGVIQFEKYSKIKGNFYL